MRAKSDKVFSGQLVEVASHHRKWRKSPTRNHQQHNQIMEKKTKTVQLTKEKDTKNTVKFAEVQTQGEPQIVGTLYVQKCYAACGIRNGSHAMPPTSRSPSRRSKPHQPDRGGRQRSSRFFKRMTERTFHRTVVQVEVLSEAPFGSVDLDMLHHMITEGDCSGHLKTVLEEELDGKQAAEALLNQARDPSFFNLTADGEDLD
jgi:hypothetical protein